ncbi:MAG: hypothetical protein KA297_15865 [Kofleriaceae bacterium]|nr:hypothetical protein [Kofleriaceae bacterium]
MKASALAVAVWLAGAPACAAPPAGSSHGAPTPPAARPRPALAPLLAPAAPAASPRWMTVEGCARCHGPSEHALRGPGGEDLAPSTGWSTSMMGLAARDPYFLAALSRELWRRPAARPLLERTCLGCHAPMGVREAVATGQHLGLHELLGGDSVAARLGRDGVSCLGCHAITADGLGTPTSFTGGFVTAAERVAFGPRPDPVGAAMAQMIHVEARYGPHLSSSALCGSCHTVELAPMQADGSPAGPSYLEQATYLEWRNSDFRTEAPAGPTPTSCIDCHMAQLRTTDAGVVRGVDADGVVLSSRPPSGLPARDGVRRHQLAGGNAYLLRVLADDPAAVGSRLAPAALRTAAAASEQMLATAAALRLADVHLVGGRLRATVTVINQTGHKLPTGYPFRRMWLRWVARDRAGQVVATGGQHRAGALVDHRGQRLDPAGVTLPHRDRITDPDEIALWEAIPVDGAGRRSHQIVDTVGLGKDNRILPAGWRVDHPDGARLGPTGVGADPTFVAGADQVQLDVPAAAAAALEVELLYQSIPPETLDSYHGVPGRAPLAFIRMTARTPPLPVRLAQAQALVAPR